MICCLLLILVQASFMTLCRPPLPTSLTLGRAILCLGVLWNDVQLQPKRIDWNSATLWFKWLSQRDINVCPILRPLLATILCVYEIWSGSNNRVYMYHVYHCVAKQKTKNKNKKVTAPTLKPTNDQKPETFLA